MSKIIKVSNKDILIDDIERCLEKSIYKFTTESLQSNSLSVEDVAWMEFERIGVIFETEVHSTANHKISLKWSLRKKS